MYVSILLSIIVLSLGTYLIWPSRYNIPAHTSLAFSFVAYFIPTIIQPDIISSYNSDSVDLYAKILLAGAVFYIFGMLLGYKLKLCISLSKQSFVWINISETTYCKKVSLMTVNITIFAIIGMIVSFGVMGVIPIFARDPIAAKFMRGSYQENYAKIAILYRTCNYLLQFTIPLLLVLWYYYRKRIYMISMVLSVFILLACFARSPAFSGFVLGIGIIAAYTKRLFKYYILFLFFTYGFGSMFYYLVGAATYGLKIDANIFEIMAAGAPDIPDQLNFLTHFIRQPEYTYGRTFWGGLIPSHYFWNPSVWSLHIVSSGSDVNEIISGGLRLLLPVWGYVSFSWTGVVFLSLFVGFLSGKFIRKTQRLLIKTKNIVIKAIIILLYIKVYAFFINFHLMSIYNLPVLFIMIFYLYNIKLKSTHAIAIANANAEKL
jgi:hypothetical protein